MPRSPRLLACFAMLIAAVVVAAGDASGAARDAGLADATRPRTITVTPLRIGELAVGGRRLAWGDVFQGIQIFDRVTHRVTTLARRLCSDSTAMTGPVLAGKRVLFACEVGGNSDLGATVFTAALDDRRVRLLRSWEVSWQAGDVGELYGYPVRIVGGGARPVFYGFDGSWERPDAGVWRVVGRRALRVPYQPGLLSAIAVAGRRLATAELVTRCGCDRLPAWSPVGQQLAWNHGGTIWLMRSNGSGQRQLSAAGAADPNSGPRWSPSGSRLAFAGQGNIYLINGDGTNQRKLVAGDYPAWSPDGARLAFVRSNDLWIVSADGSGERRLTNDGLETTSRPDWSPDGTGLVVARAGDIYLVDAASGAERDLTPGDRPESSPVWSPDGSAIAFARGCSSNNCGGGSIYVVRPDGGGLTRVSDGETNLSSDVMPAWSPDGSRIAYLAEPAALDTQEIRTVNADGTGQKARNSREGAGAPAWSPDGRAIASGDSASGFDAVNRGHSGIYAIDPAGGRSRWLAAPTKPTSTVEVRDSISGKLLRGLELPGSVSSVALSSRYLVAEAWRRDRGHVLERYDVSRGDSLGTAPFPRAASAISLAGRWGVCRVGHRIRLLDVKTGRTSTLAIAGKGAVGPVISSGRVFWAEDYRQGSRVREIVLS